MKFAFFFSTLIAIGNASIPPRSGVTHDASTDRYMVLLRPEATSQDIQFHTNFVDRFKHDEEKDVRWFSFEENGHTVKGYSARFRSIYQVATLREDSSVELVEPDHEVQIWKVQHDAPWGLARISHRDIPEKNDYLYRDDGEGVKVYVIDTGIRIQHHDFNGRAVLGKKFVSRGNPDDTEDFTDDNGHGTHCAGIVAGSTYGVCKKCTVVAVKVLDAGGSGSMSDVIAGIEYVVQKHKEGKNPTVISMSLGGMYSEVMNRVVDSATNIGVHVVVAAGNSRDDACDYSPASAKTAVSVGATSLDDNMASFSNYGKCTSIFAPGVDILSAWINGDDAALTLSGTSMAAPHVAGFVGALLSRDEYKDYKPKQIKNLLRKMATKDSIENIPLDLKTDNLLLFNGEQEDSVIYMQHEEL